MTTAPAGELATRLAEVFGAPCNITDLHILTGGASRETWSFAATVTPADDVSGAGVTSHRLILRRDPAGAAPRMRAEVAALREAARVGVSVPEVVDSCIEAPAAFGGAYLIMTWVEGEAQARRILTDPHFDPIRPHLAYEMGRTLARIHRMDPDAVPGLPDDDPVDALFAEYTATGDPLPVLEIAFGWLRRNRPRSSRKTLVHGDFRVGNLLVSAKGIESVLDWELAHRGDPLEDLGWLCTPAWRFGSPERVGGVGDLTDLLRGYRDEGGVSADPDEVGWWEIYGSLRWAVICRQQAERGAAGTGHDSLELLAVGRRVAECEHDLLTGLGHRPGDRRPTPDDPERNPVGSPTVPELLTAVTDFVGELTADADGRTRHRGRVTAHILRMVAREWSVPVGDREECSRLLRAAGYASESELALAMRAGTAGADTPGVVAAVIASVEVRLAVANPRYARHA